MNSDYYNELPDLDIDGLLSDAVVDVLSHEDPQQFFSWLRHSIPTYFNFDTPFLADEALLRSMTTTLGLAIWNAIPLPGNQFRPRTLPQPQRGRACPCGSGLTYKHCCGRLSKAIEIESDALWPLVLDHLPEMMRKMAVKSGRVPVEVIVHMANEFGESGNPRKAAVLLEPLFDGDVGTPDEAHDFALNALCNYYDDLGFNKKKMKLLKHMINTLPRSPLRAGAWQRLSAIHMDEGDTSTAWVAFLTAQRDDPDSLGIGVLELQLLVADNKIEQARQRARFWVKRLRKLGYADDTPPLDHLLLMAKNPLVAMTEVGMSITGGAGERLQIWVERVADRALPRYEVNSENQCPGDSTKELCTILNDRLQQIGVSREQNERSINRMSLDYLNTDAHTIAGSSLRDTFDMLENDSPQSDTTVSLVLKPPQHISALSAQWREVFPLNKPLSVHDEAFGLEYAWDMKVEDGWATFLEEHPQAFDSLDILDDLATALIQHPQFGAHWLDCVLLAPVLERAHDIICRSLESHSDVKLIWGVAQNRPVLRNLARLAMLYWRRGEEIETERMIQWLLNMNPEDNHGLRRLLMNGLLRKGEDAQALLLSEQFPDDHQIEIRWGRVLALYRLGSTGEATKALCNAIDCFPKVLRQITHERVKKPKIDPMRVEYGEDDQAWLYREEMRDVWKSTPGILAWMKKMAKSCGNRVYK